jgi:short-subunit dehydrogenase
MKHDSTKTVLITGATAGIGRHAALHLAARGHLVFATGRSREALASLAAESNGRIEIVPLDVTDAASIAAAASQVRERLAGRGLDVLINNAGFGIAVPTLELTDADLRSQYETNVFGLMNVTRAFLPDMVARRRGRVINVSSIGGRFTFPFFGGYNSTKYAVESLSDALRREVRPFGVDVVLVEPGPIRSNFANRSMDGVNRYRSATSPYAAVYARADQIQAMTEKNSYSPMHTSRAITRAVESRRPSARYLAPGHMAAMLWLLNGLPTRWVDALLAVATGINPRGLGVSAQPAAASLPSVQSA